MATTNKQARGKIKRVITDIAPTLAHALGGPLAGVAVSKISQAIFGTSDKDEKALGAVIANATPEQWILIKKAEQEFVLALRAAKIEEQRIHASDRSNARARQVDLNDWMPSALGALIILGFFIVLSVMISRRLPDGAETEFSIMLGALATMTAAVVNYYFGSSVGSKEKTRLMALQVPQVKTIEEEGGENEISLP